MSEITKVSGRDTYQSASIMQWVRFFLFPWISLCASLAQKSCVDVGDETTFFGKFFFVISGWKAKVLSILLGVRGCAGRGGESI